MFETAARLLLAFGLLALSAASWANQDGGYFNARRIGNIRANVVAHGNCPYVVDPAKTP